MLCLGSDTIRSEGYFCGRGRAANAASAALGQNDSSVRRDCALQMAECTAMDTTVLAMAASVSASGGGVSTTSSLEGGQGGA